MEQKENPYVFECTNDTYVSGALLNYLAQNKSVAMFKADAALVMTVYGEYITETYNDADELHLFRKNPKVCRIVMMIADCREQKVRIQSKAAMLHRKLKVRLP